jgi:acyl carrier protein
MLSYMATAEDDQVRASVRATVADLAPEARAEIRADSRLVDDLGYHSLALLELAFALEEEYSLPSIDEAIASQIHTVSDIEGYILMVLRERQDPDVDAGV